MSKSMTHLREELQQREGWGGLYVKHARTQAKE